MIHIFEAASAVPSDEGGRRFKSCHSDQYLAKLPVASGTTSGTDTPAANGILSKRKMAQPKESIRKITKPVAEKYARLTQFWKSSRYQT
jgi:hypothetical protein